MTSTPELGVALRAVCLALPVLLVAGAATALPLLSEILYDAPGSDDGIVFVELWGAPGTDLSGFTLEGVNGSDGGVTASVALAMVGGFLSLIPGGVVVREAVLAELMVPHFEVIMPHLGQVIAVVSALLLRLVWLVAELVISGILYVGAGRGRQSPPAN